MTSPREAALRILAARDRSKIDMPPTSLPLAAFQHEAFERATAILQRRRGVLIADSVGLGKTFVALALIEAAIRRADPVLVVVPASLRRMWRTELKRLAVPADDVTLISHTGLALRGCAGIQPGLVVVDEAHAFRNPRTRRYRALRGAVCSAKVVLLTATPVNNSLADLYFQLSLFCADGAFHDLGIGSLRAALLDGNSLRDAEFARLRRAVMVRRTRSQIRGTEPQGLRFPKRVIVVPVSYALPLGPAAMRGLLQRLSFVAYRLERDDTFSPEVLRFGLMKRLESSGFAIQSTLRRQIRYYEQLLGALSRGLILRPRTFRSLYQPTDDSLQLVLEPLALVKPAGGISNQCVEQARAELATLREWSDALSMQDDKLRVLLDLLKARSASSKILIFTEYRETASYIWRALRQRFAVGLIDGSGAWIGASSAPRRQVIDRFAPVANGAHVHEREAIRVLIATDVLAEGMNLQDADTVISYDLPWNPIRLIQRAGRVDRIGSPHEVVTVFNFIPDREFDAFLGLARTIRRKLDSVRASVGLDGAVLEPDDAFETVFKALKSGDSTILDQIELRETQVEPQVRHRFDAPLPASGTPIAAVPGASETRALVALQRGTEWRTAVIDLRTGEETPEHPAHRILEGALELETGGCVPPEVCDIAERFAAQVAAGPTDRRSAAGRVARLVRHRLLELQLDGVPAVYFAADQVLSGLARVVDTDVEMELAVVLRRDWSTLSELLRTVQKALSASRNPAPPPLGWRITGVIIAD